MTSRWRSLGMTIGGRSLGMMILLTTACGVGTGAQPPRAQPATPNRQLLAASRIAALPEPKRSEWTAYLRRSTDLRARDTAFVNDELRRLGLQKWTRAAYVRDAFEVTPAMTGPWLAGDAARTLGDAILSFQTPSGGWSKHIDFTKGPRQPGQSFFSESEAWQYIATFDNNATTSEIEFLGRLNGARPEMRYRQAMGRGLAYTLDAQMPNGCWPQVFPLQGEYHDAVTFNDDVVVHAMEVLTDVAGGKYGWLGVDERAVASRAVARGLDCILATQVVVKGTRTGWGQQHDPLTLEPVGARSYEPASLSSKESAAIGLYLLSLPQPSVAVIGAAHALADWFERTKITGYEYTDAVLRQKAGASPIWARMMEIGTDRPIFSNRDGVILYDWNQLTDRREGYGWFSDAPAAFLKRYAVWARTHPRTR